jgi:hypothetical protein
VLAAKKVFCKEGSEGMGTPPIPQNAKYDFAYESQPIENCEHICYCRCMYILGVFIWIILPVLILGITIYELMRKD